MSMSKVTLRRGVDHPGVTADFGENMTGKVGIKQLREKSKQDTDAPDVIRRTDNPDHFTWSPNIAAGTGTWLWPRAATSVVPAAKYKAQVYKEDSSSPTVRLGPIGETTYEVIEPETGPIS